MTKPKQIGRKIGTRVIRFGSKEARKYWLEVRRKQVFAVYDDGIDPCPHLSIGYVNKYIKQGVWAFRKS